MKTKCVLVAAALIGLAWMPAVTSGETLVFANARVIPIESGGKAAPEIEKGYVVVEDGKIKQVGSGEFRGSGATVIDCAGKWIIPGLVDTHSHVGGIGGADNSATIQPSVRVADSLNPFDSGYRRVTAGGLTTLNVMSGSGHLLSGQTVYLKMRMFDGKPAKRVEDLAYRDERGNLLGGIKMANGTNSLREPPFSGTRGKSAAMVREAYIRAQEYQKKWKDYDAKAAAAKPVVENAKLTPPARDLGMDALVEVLEGKRIVHHHTHRADDIITVLRIAKEFGYKVVLHHTSEAWKVPQEIAAAQKEGIVLGCSIIQIDSPGGKLEAADKSFATGGVLERAGVRVGHHTDDWINDSRLFLRCAAIGVRGGMSREAALRGLTLSGAEMLGLEKQVGSLEPGKDADLVILSGDPFSVYTHVEQTWVEGRKVFDRANPKDKLHAVGGFGAGRDQEPYFCCFGE
jgi:imidazolonepropionase-like amidohydrolase